jgi:hypothetical protein
MAFNLYLILGRAGGIHKRAGDHGKKSVPFVEHPDTCSPGIADVSHMIQGARNFAVAATGAFGVIDPYFGHDENSWAVSNLVARGHRA